MNLLNFIAFLFYSYYSKGPRKPVRYLSTILSMSLILFITLLGLLSFFGLTGDMLPHKTDNRLWNYLRGGIVALPLLLLIWYFIPSERDLKKIKYSNEVIQKGKMRLFIGIMFSIILTIILIILRQKHNIPKW